MKKPNLTYVNKQKNISMKSRKSTSPFSSAVSDPMNSLQNTYLKEKRINMIINKTSLDCKQSFRDALDSLIIKRNYMNKISIIRYPMWNNNYSKDLKQLYLEDGMHLNSNGYSKLDSIIAIEITDTYH